MYILLCGSASEAKRKLYENKYWPQVVNTVKECVEIKERDHLDVTIGLQMVLMPQDADQIIPLARLGNELGVDYVVIKHCSDDEFGTLGVDYSKYASLTDVLQTAEKLSSERTFIK